MGLGKQSKVLNKSQIEVVRTFLRSKRNGLRNETIFLLSVKSGLRSKEISLLSWNMVCKSDGTIDDYINLPNSSTMNTLLSIYIHACYQERYPMRF